ncbi:MAG: hypothetical protein A2Y71_02350 [Bacteroidetes bacterium RBG_13_42_15]|nr:MAG: hypothetical protein A2Y71_02350 [Bacteroidetes bacterium RBG_13_42_15]
MMRQVKSRNVIYILTGILFVIYFLYFALLNPHHIHYLEQNQLFIWSLDFLKEKFALPGGLADYSGSFFTQFFYSSWLGAFIYTLNAIAVFVLSFYICKRHNLNNIIVSFVPVWLLAILQSSELFTFNQAAGFLLQLSFFALFITVKKTANRYILFFAGWPVMYILTGGFSIPVILLCLLHELLFRKEKKRFIVTLLFILTGVLVPYLSARLIFYIQPDKIFIYPVVSELHSIFLYALIVLIGWTPLMVLAGYFIDKAKSLKDRLLPWSIINIATGITIIIVMAVVVYKRAYNKMADMMLGVDHYAQRAEWDKLLKLSGRYPGYNTLVIYYTNLALYKSGKLMDRMFHYPQIGSQGLRLKWQRNLNLFFGGEVFSQLAYNNESIHWAFEALVAKGMNPRSLKKLAIGCTVNGNYDIALKYLSLLDRTLFYRQWAQQHMRYLSDPELMRNDPELSEYLDLLVSTNFFSEVNGLNLQDLLKNHPENKMAYEYLLASLLLDRNLDGFASAVQNMKYYGYKSMPLHIEEALIFYNFYENKNLVPEGYSLRQITINRFNDYATAYTAYRSDRKTAASELGKKYRKTYWYYLQFPDN